MYKLLRMAFFTLPLAGGMAWAQSSASDGTPGAPTGINPEGGAATTDTRTPTQKRAGQMDTLPPAVPGDATTKPMGVPPTAPESDRAGLPDSASRPEQLPSKKSPKANSDEPHHGDISKMQDNSDK
jgi:hypothetical protein